RLSVVRLEHFLDANEGNRAALQRGIQRRAIEVVAMRRAIARPVAPENGHIEIGIGAAHKGADIGKSTVDVTLSGEEPVDVERTWQRAQLRLQCLVPFLLPAC